MGTLGTGRPGQPCHRPSDAATGSEKRPYVATQKVSMKDLLFNFKAVCARNDDGSASLCAWPPPLTWARSAPPLATLPQVCLVIVILLEKNVTTDSTIYFLLICQ